MKYLLCNNEKCLPILSINKNGRRYSCTLAYLKEQKLTRINIQLYRDNNLYKNFNKTPSNECYSYKIIADGINILINNKKERERKNDKRNNKKNKKRNERRKRF